jgi:hypothetical protein
MFIQQLALQDGTLFIVAMAGILEVSPVETNCANFDLKALSVKKIISTNFTKDLQEELAAIKKRLDASSLTRKNETNASFIVSTR